ncbi:hypothetical protein FB45DRAFT_938903 [Roridomyces roridus]|uniref:Uncharacterized protein n=1 Tax=Roridomyces roridus TaxID=1738132 RepID=A0AAD7B7M7_9AGAR|nr:hypothetical protein FB45DRAFT_938903 [Roridomyces roridus]
MTRSSSPNGAVEFSYEFPRASTSALPVPSPRRPRSPQSNTLRRPSPTRHYHSDIDDDGADDNDYEAFGYPHFRTNTLPVPLPHTGNQWAHLHPQPSYAFPSSFDSEMSALSSASQSQSKLGGAASSSHCPVRASAKKIRKPHHTRASLDEPPSSHSYSYSYTSSQSQDIYDEPSSYSDDDADVEDEEAIPESTTTTSPSSSLHRQWAALSLRVRFGVFRAKRRIRMHTIARVTSL